MRLLLVASLVAGLASNAVAHSSVPSSVPQPRIRKTLGFGPAHPHAVYHSNPYQIVTNSFLPQNPDSDPFDVAKLFLDDILSHRLTHSSSYKIRKDSYTDKTTGITHVYARQIVNGIEVADGDINVNVKEGKIISYGNSFYTGPSPAPFTNPNSDKLSQPHKEYCNYLEKEILGQISAYDAADGQSVLHRTSVSHAENHACAGEQDIPDFFVSSFPQYKSEISDPRHALLQFMMAATTRPIEEIADRYDSILANMSIWDMSTFAPFGEQLSLVINDVPETVNPVKGSLAYIQVPDKNGDQTHLQLVWKFEVEMQDNWYETAVSATAPHNIISVVDWASDSPIPVPQPSTDPATYNVFAWGVNDPDDGNRTNEKENFDSLASPMGWHSIPYINDPSMDGVRLRTKEFFRNTSSTWGNNVFAQENWEGRNSFIDNSRPESNIKDFNYTYAPKVTDKADAQAESYKHINATVTQLFYTCNMIHDIYYRYGFDEVSGNFQQYNFKRGGAENDAVIANAQDGSGYNNANFMTPPDGQNGRMRMYLWNTALPYRDGDFEAGIVIHEYSHGLSTRLTGGPANSGCLGWGEAGGMGEGWGDFFATTIRSSKIYKDYPMGAWAANRPGGIRNYPYSLNATINPSTYKTLDSPGYWGVHAIGEVWAQILWLVEQRLIAVHGYSEELYPPQPDEEGNVPIGDFYRPRVGKKPLVPKHGNTLSFQLVLNGMKLQPCRPGFFEARDAIIQADQELTGGENYCTLWNAFGERGLGMDALVENRTPWGGGFRTNGYKVPITCQ